MPYFRSNLSSKYKSVLALLSHKVAFLIWVHELKTEIYQRYFEDNQLHPIDVNLTLLETKHYLDTVIAQRAQTYGFQLNNYKLPVVLTQTSNKIFFNTIEQGFIFLDVANASTQASLGHSQAQRMKLRHGEYSHALQLLFLAEYIPNFVEIYKSFSQGANKKAWSLWLDNPNEFNATNPAVFEHFTFQLLLSK